MKKILSLILLSASALASAAQYDFRYLQENTAGGIVERIVTLTPGTFLSVNGSGQIAVQSASAFRAAIGLGNVDNTSDANKPISTATQTALDGKQPLDSDLTSIAALTTTSYGRAFLALADAAAGRTALGLGTMATQNGTFSGTSSGTNTGDQTITLSGAVTGSGTGAITTTLAAGQARSNLTGGSGALDLSLYTLTLPATLPASSGVNLTALNASQLTSGTVPAARLTDLPASPTFTGSVTLNGNLNAGDAAGDNHTIRGNMRGQDQTAANSDSYMTRDLVRAESATTSVMSLVEWFPGSDMASGRLGTHGWSLSGWNQFSRAPATTAHGSGYLNMRPEPPTATIQTSKLWLGGDGAGTMLLKDGLRMEIYFRCSWETSFFVGFVRQDATVTTQPTGIIPAWAAGVSFTPAAAAWQASTAYAPANPNPGIVRPTTPNGRKYQLTTAGTTGAAEPTWPLTVGGTVADGSAVWTCLGPDGATVLRAICSGADPIASLAATSTGVTVASAYTNYRVALRVAGGTLYASVNGGVEVSVPLANLGSGVALQPFFCALRDNTGGFPNLNLMSVSIYVP